MNHLLHFFSSFLVKVIMNQEDLRAVTHFYLENGDVDAWLQREPYATCSGGLRDRQPCGRLLEVRQRVAQPSPGAGRLRHRVWQERNRGQEWEDLCRQG